MSEPRTITGHTVVMVKTTDGEVPMHRGDTLPANLPDGELERLTKAGAFDAPPVADLRRQGAQRKNLIAPALTDDLPPTVTLAANEEDGTPSPSVPPSIAGSGPLLFTDEEREAAEAAALGGSDDDRDPPAPPPPPPVENAKAPAAKKRTAPEK